MFHIAAYQAANAFGQSNVDTAAITDGIIPVSNNHFMPYTNYNLIMAYVAGASLTRGRLNSGTIRQINPTYIRPININLLPGNNPNVMYLFDNPFLVQAHEELALELSNNKACTTDQEFGVIWLERQREVIPQGRVFNLRLTSTSTAAVRAWTLIAYTLETSLPAGRYAVIGAELQSTNGVAFRLVFDQQVERPGHLMTATLGNRPFYLTMYGGLGKWGEFNTYSLPRLEVLCNAADAAFEGYMEVVQVSHGLTQY